MEQWQGVDGWSGAILPQLSNARHTRDTGLHHQTGGVEESGAEGCEGARKELRDAACGREGRPPNRDRASLATETAG